MYQVVCLLLSQKHCASMSHLTVGNENLVFSEGIVLNSWSPHSVCCCFLSSLDSRLEFWNTFFGKTTSDICHILCLAGFGLFIFWGFFLFFLLNLYRFYMSWVYQSALILQTRVVWDPQPSLGHPGAFWAQTGTCIAALSWRSRGVTAAVWPQSVQ